MGMLLHLQFAFELFFSQWSSQNYCFAFLIFWVSDFKDFFFKNLKLTIISYRKQWFEIWDAVTSILGTFDLVVFRVILGSFSASVRHRMSPDSITADRRRKRSEIWYSVVVGILYMLYGVDLLVFKVLVGSFGTLVSKMCCNSKMAGRRGNRNEIWNSGVVLVCIWGTSDLAVFKVILGSFCALISKCPVTRKRQAIRIVLFLIWDTSTTYRGYLWLLWNCRASELRFCPNRSSSLLFVLVKTGRKVYTFMYM